MMAFKKLELASSCVKRVYSLDGLRWFKVSLSENRIPLNPYTQWPIQVPKIELLCHLSGHICWGYSQKHKLYIDQRDMVGTSNKSVPEMATDIAMETKKKTAIVR